MTTGIQVDAKQVDAKQVDAKRQALAFPEQLQQLRATLAELLLENAALRWQLDRLAGRVDALERRAGSGGR